MPLVYAPNAQALAGITDLLTDYSERLKRFVIFDSINGENPSNVTKPNPSTNAALYYPWISVKPTELSQLCLIPPGGHIAGIYARNDIERGIHKAPANQLVKGASGLEYPITDSQQDELYSKNINCIRKFDCRGNY